jgi:hypothetical protein
LGFIDNAETLMGLLNNQDHVETLGENLQEEMGEYDEGMLLACKAMGIQRESIRGVPHRDLFKGLVEFLETVLQHSYLRFIPRDICEKLNQAINYARGCGQLGLLSVLYFRSKLIVPDIFVDPAGIEEQHRQKGARPSWREHQLHSLTIESKLATLFHYRITFLLDC